MLAGTYADTRAGGVHVVGERRTECTQYIMAIQQDVVVWVIGLLYPYTYTPCHLCLHTHTGILHLLVPRCLQLCYLEES